MNNLEKGFNIDEIYKGLNSLRRYIIYICIILIIILLMITYIIFLK